MNDKLVKELNNNVDSVKISANNNLADSIIVKINYGFGQYSKVVADEIMEFKLKDFMPLVINNLKSISKYMKKVDFDHPNKRTFFGKLFGIPQDADLNPTTLLANELRYVNTYYVSINNTINEIERMKRRIINGRYYEYESSSSTIEGLNQIKEILIQMRSSYKLLAFNPTIIRFLVTWTKYKESVNGGKSFDYTSFLDIGNKTKK